MAPAALALRRGAENREMVFGAAKHVAFTWRGHGVRRSVGNARRAQKMTAAQRGGDRHDALCGARNAAAPAYCLASYVIALLRMPRLAWLRGVLRNLSLTRFLAVPLSHDKLHAGDAYYAAPRCAAAWPRQPVLQTCCGGNCIRISSAAIFIRIGCAFSSRLVDNISFLRTGGGSRLYRVRACVERKRRCWLYRRAAPGWHGRHIDCADNVASEKAAHAMYAVTLQTRRSRVCRSRCCGMPSRRGVLTRRLLQIEEA